MLLGLMRLIGFGGRQIGYCEAPHCAVFSSLLLGVTAALLPSEDNQQ
jgi:hypothetical protein